MSAQSDPRRENGSGVESKYYYRRRLSGRELLPALGAAVGAGLAAFYLAKIFLERTPLSVESTAGGTPHLSLHRSSRSLSTARNAGRR